MRRPELDNMINTMLASQPEVSDLLFTVDRPPQVESYGELKPVVLDPPIAITDALPDGDDRAQSSSATICC